MGTAALVIFLAILTFEKLFSKHQERKNLESENNAQLALEAQRFEKIKEILTDGVIDGSPKALEALRPMVQMVANQAHYEYVREQCELDHERRLEELKAMSKAFKLWNKQARTIWNGTGTIGGFQKGITALQEATNKVFPRLALPAPNLQESEAVPFPPESPQFHILEEGGSG